MDVPACLLRAVQGIWNSGWSVTKWTAMKPEDLEKIKNTNGYIMLNWASWLDGYFEGWPWEYQEVSPPSTYMEIPDGF